ncbi:hypothetical protein QUG02_16925 [Bacillus hominis]|uniref:Rubrerythrin diiron-binding domain-containing protein n=1 Tax=Bacillus hominis TaxID=2817478 RepID=A0ABT7R9Y4_9BACI|nr:hypothetical protein [Bacillus hominis]MDM5439749.1 hypothetical protein [Bacillus hominis]
MEKQSVANTLNVFLKGQYMGVHAYEQYIEKLKYPESHILIHDILDKDRDHVNVLKQLTY